MNRRKEATKTAENPREGCKAFEARFPAARCLWEQRVPRVGMIAAYALGKTIVLIQEYANGNGWNAFTPTTDEGRVDLTLDAIAKRAGIGV